SGLERLRRERTGEVGKNGPNSLNGDRVPSHSYRRERTVVRSRFLEPPPPRERDMSSLLRTLAEAELRDGDLGDGLVEHEERDVVAAERGRLVVDSLLADRVRCLFEGVASASIDALVNGDLRFGNRRRDIAADASGLGLARGVTERVGIYWVFGQTMLRSE